MGETLGHLGLGKILKMGFIRTWPIFEGEG